jgi:hypothetical protein
MVLRYNYLKGAKHGGHGTESTVGRGVRVSESYKNTFDFLGMGSSFGNQQIRSGTMLNWSNKTLTDSGVVFTNRQPVAFREWQWFQYWGGANGRNPLDNNDTECPDALGTPCSVAPAYNSTHAPHLFYQGTVAQTANDSCKVTGSPGWGADVWKDYYVSRGHPVGPGKINNASGYSVGANSITVDGFTGAVFTGDTFRIATETGSPVHLITSHAEVGGNTTTINFSPGIADTPLVSPDIADNAVVTIIQATGLIDGNSNDTLTVDGQINGQGTQQFTAGETVFIYRLARTSLDQAGAGKSNVTTGRQHDLAASELRAVIRLA